MELDPDFCLLDCFMRISNNARKKREEEDKLRASQGGEVPAVEASTSPSPPLHSTEKHKSFPDDEPVRQENLLLGGSPSAIDISRGERRMKEDNIIVQKPRRSMRRKKIMQSVQDIRYEDYKLMISASREKSWEEYPRYPSPCEAYTTEAPMEKPILQMDDFKALKFAPYFTSLDTMLHMSMAANDLLEKEEPLGENRQLKRERFLKKQAVEEILNKGSANQQEWFKSEDIEEEEEAKALKKNKTATKGFKKGVRKSPNYIPKLPKEIMDFIRRENGFNEKLVIQKQLYPTDLSVGQNRISMPFNQLHEPNFLTKAEEQLLMSRTSDRKNRMGINVLFIEPNGERNFELVFKRWDMPKEDGHNTSSMYLFNGKWNNFCKRYKLEKGTIVQVWSFRYDGEKLGFAMVIVDRDTNASSSENGNGISESRDGNDNNNKN